MGNSFIDPTQTRFHKNQIFSKTNHGIQVIRDKAGPRGAPAVVPPPPQHDEPTHDLPVAVPAYVALDRMVLRFFAYFKEAVHESRAEHFRVRKVTILYYLEDNTIQVNEPKEENSGIPQGVLVKRHHIPNGKDQFFTVVDLACGSELTFYGRTFRVVDCDGFTAEFFHENGLDIGEPEDSLGSFYSLVPKAPKANWAKYFEHDKKILRFVAQLDTRAPEDRERLFIVSYYLADDTIIVYE